MNTEESETQEKVKALFGADYSMAKTTQKTLQFQTKLRQDNRDRILKQKRTMALFTPTSK